MDGQVVILLKDAIDKVDSKVERIEEKVNQLLEFKWQIIGGSLIVSFMVGVAIQVAVAIMSKS